MSSFRPHARPILRAHLPRHSDPLGGTTKTEDVEKGISILRSHQDADASDVAEDLSSTPQQRINNVLDLQAGYQPDVCAQGFAGVY
jgi:hypothetical protein